MLRSSNSAFLDISGEIFIFLLARMNISVLCMVQVTMGMVYWNRKRGCLHSASVFLPEIKNAVQNLYELLLIEF